MVFLSVNYLNSLSHSPYSSCEQSVLWRWRIQWGTRNTHPSLGPIFFSISCSVWNNGLFPLPDSDSDSDTDTDSCTMYNRLAHILLGLAPPFGKFWIRHCTDSASKVTALHLNHNISVTSASQVLLRKELYFLGF